LPNFPKEMVCNEGITLIYFLSVTEFPEGRLYFNEGISFLYYSNQFPKEIPFGLKLLSCETEVFI
jgi:hypothetical protein